MLGGVRIVVTGGTGYLGSHVVRELLSRSHHVITLSRRASSARGSDQSARHESTALDLTGSGADDELRALLSGESIDAIVHLAGDKDRARATDEPLQHYRSCLHSLRAVIDAAVGAGVSRLVIGSTAAVYGSAAGRLEESTRPAPETVYGRAALAAEWLAAASARAHGLDVTALRVFNAAGAADSALADTAGLTIVPQVLAEVRAGRPARIHGDDWPTPDGTCVRDLVHPADIASAFALAVEAADASRGGDFHVYNVGSGRGTSVRELVEGIRSRVPGAPPSVVLPRRPGDVAVAVASIDAIASQLGWRPSEGLEQILDSAVGARISDPSQHETLDSGKATTARRSGDGQREAESVSSRIYLSPPDVGAREEEALVRAIRSGWVAPLGPEVDAFEREVAERAGRAHAVALSSGTAGLHLGLLALGVGEGDVVVTASMTFAATVNAVVYTGAEPVLVDSDAVSGCIDVALLEQELASLAREGRRIGAILPVDLLGRMADYDAILDLAQRYGAPVLADAAESLGSRMQGRPAGSAGDAAVFSFNGNKVMTTSGGGMLVTDRRDIAERVRHLATQAREPAPHYEHDEIGYNYRLSNLLAALGRAQLSRLDEMISRRRAVRERYRAFFADRPGLSLLHDGSDRGDNHWLTAVLVDPAEPWAPDDLRQALAAVDIESRPLWKPMHLQPVHRRRRARVNGVAQKMFEQGLALPSGSALTDADVDRVLTVIDDFLSSRSRG